MYLGLDFLLSDKKDAHSSVALAKAALKFYYDEMDRYNECLRRFGKSHSEAIFFNEGDFKITKIKAKRGMLT